MQKRPKIELQHNSFGKGVYERLEWKEELPICSQLWERIVLKRHCRQTNLRSTVSYRTHSTFWPPWPWVRTTWRRPAVLASSALFLVANYGHWLVRDSQKLHSVRLIASSVGKGMKLDGAHSCFTTAEICANWFSHGTNSDTSKERLPFCNFQFLYKADENCAAVDWFLKNNCEGIVVV